jgi:hypothetical protein
MILNEARSVIVEPSLALVTRNAQHLHHRDHPLASMQMLSNSPRFVSAFSASVLAAATAFVASN